jgi:uncharacterized membrane protein YjgN (DUF898 family)
MDQGPSTMQQSEGTGPAAPPPVYAERRAIPFQFTGNTSEYFRIWVVNTLLTIATLGIYSAWAKVRTKQYFYRNTLVDGVGFDYLADPIAILKGRIIVAVALGLMAWSQYYYLPVYLALLLLLFLATPWVVAKSLAFNARNSAYRNIRFAFPGRVGEAFGVYLKTSLFYLVTCGLGYPWAQWTLTRFVVWRHYYGDLQLTWHAKCSEYYRIYIIALAMIIPGYAILIGVMIATTVKGKPPNPLLMTIPMVVFFLYLLIPTAYLRAQLSNLLYGKMMVGNHWFVSTQRPMPLLSLYATNAVAILASFGLLIPWAKIRLAKYRAETLTIQAVGSLYAEALLTDNTSAIGDGMTDLGDFDLGIGT